MRTLTPIALAAAALALSACGNSRQSENHAAAGPANRVINEFPPPPKQTGPQEPQFGPEEAMAGTWTNRFEHSDFNGCWLIEGKSVPNIGSRGRTTASLSWTERSKKIDVSLGSQTLEDVESRLSDLDRFHIDCQIVFPTMFFVDKKGTIVKHFVNFQEKATLEATIAALKAFQAVGALAPMVGGIDILAAATGSGGADFGAGEFEGPFV